MTSLTRPSREFFNSLLIQAAIGVALSFVYWMTVVAPTTSKRRR